MMFGTAKGVKSSFDSFKKDRSFPFLFSFKKIDTLPFSVEHRTNRALPFDLGRAGRGGADPVDREKHPFRES